jgi:sugar transferase EpsL
MRATTAPKRLLDLVGACVGLILLAPVWAYVSWRVRRELGSPVLFHQLRPGFRGQPFTLVKFRTMTDERGPDGERLPDDQRLPPFGRWLRRTSLDESPELWNVLRGDMSLVGPRPLLMEYLDRYTPEQARRHEVKPGITGWSQVNGRNDQPWSQKLALDVWYVDHRSFWLDLKILARTAGVALSGRGVSLAGHETTVPFLGDDEQGTDEPPTDDI